MNREIKFRIWSKKYKLFTNDLRWPSNQHTHEEFLLSPSGEVWRFVTSCSDEEHYFRDLNCGEYIVQRATGMKDRRRKDVYEGDIFESEDDYKWDAIKFKDGRFTVNLRGARLFDLSEIFEDNDKPKVIGNILENPELLK